MRINNISKFQNQSNPINFKQGLTRDVVTHVKNMPPDEYQRIAHRLWKKYGMISNFGCSNTVAFCTEQTANIMSRAGFTLPAYFSFRDIGSDLGQYDITDCVIINSSRNEYLDLAQLNKTVEQANYYNDSKHFLDTYLHEFLHAAHFKNIKKKTYYEKSKDIFFDELSSFNPSNTMQNPLVSFIMQIFPSMTKKQIKSLFPEKEKLFSTGNLTEYFAEKNSKVLESQLGQNIDINNIQQNMASHYVGFPENWSINYEIEKINELPFFRRLICAKLKPSERDERIKESLENILNKFEGEIWNGNVDEIKNKSTAFRNYGTSKLTND